MGPMHQARADNDPAVNHDMRYIEGVENMEKLGTMCRTNQWDTFFNQLYAIKVVENIDRNIVGNIERANSAKYLADRVAQALDGTSLSDLHAEECLAKIRQYIKAGTEPFASKFLESVEHRLVKRLEAAASGWAQMAVFAHGTHPRVGQESSLMMVRENADVLRVIALHVTETL